MNLPSRTEGVLAIEMVRAAAEKALDIGAPLFGGNLLAASVPWVEGMDVEALGEHILRATEIYLLAQEPGRARTLCEYAETRIGHKRLLGPRWATVIAAVDGMESHGKTIGSEPLDASDLAAAYTAVSRSLRFRRSQPSDTESP